MNDEEQVAIHPWYRGFTGEIRSTGKQKYDVLGVAEKVSNTSLKITELPIKKWTQTFKAELEAMIVGGEKKEGTIRVSIIVTLKRLLQFHLQGYTEHHDNNNAHFVIQMNEKELEKAETQGFLECFKLIGKINTGNMICFDAQGKIKKYELPEAIIEEFHPLRLAFYHKREVLCNSTLSRAC